MLAFVAAAVVPFTVAVAVPSLSLPSLPSFGGLPKLDGWTAFLVVAWLAGPLLGGWLFLGARARQGELDVQIQRAAEDSARYDRIIAATERLEARRDSIAERLRIIQEIDADRYVWAHIMDEVARVLPDYTWLSELVHAGADPLPRFRIAGYTVTTFALTRFMTDLEASPFIRSVTLVSSELVGREGELVYNFILQASYEEPPPDVVNVQPFIVLEDSSGAAPD